MNDLLDDKPMGRWQIVAVSMCVFLAALDGFDVLASAFSATGIGEEWSLTEAELGWVLSSELIGMGIGATLLGNVADKIGRRPVILFSLIGMAIGMFISASTNSIAVFVASRIFTGIGIGAVLSVANASTAEFSNKKNRGFTVTLMGAGFSIGGVIGGLMAVKLLAIYDWRAVFYLGAILTTLSIPLTYFTLPESVTFLTVRRPANALEKTNKVLSRLGHEPLNALPDIVHTEDESGGYKQLFGRKLKWTSLLLCLVFLGHIFTVYFVIKWITKIITAMGVTQAEAGQFLVWINLGALVAAIVYSALVAKFDARKLAVLSLFGSAILVATLGQVGEDLQVLTIVSIICGFFIGAGTAAIYPLMALYFPPNVRAGGIGFVLGVGRLGAIGGPIAAGLLFGLGATFSSASIILAGGSFIAAVAVLILVRNDRKSELAAS